MLLEDFLEQEQIGNDQREQFLQLVTQLSFEKLLEIFENLSADEIDFPNRKSFKKSLNLARQKLEIDELQQYVAKLADFEDKCLAKTIDLANQFANLQLYTQLYKAFFAQFFSGQNGKKNIFQKFCAKIVNL